MDVTLASEVRSAFFLVPSLFTLPGAFFLILSIEVDHDPVRAFVLLFVAEVSIWTNLSPISTVTIGVVEPNLRARSTGLLIFLQHTLGDVISPPIIGAISDASELRTGLHVTWMAVLISGMCWFAAYACLRPLPPVSDAPRREQWANSNREDDHERGGENRGEGREATEVYPQGAPPPLTFLSICCGEQGEYGTTVGTSKLEHGRQQRRNIVASGKGDQQRQQRRSDEEEEEEEEDGEEEEERRGSRGDDPEFGKFCRNPILATAVSFSEHRLKST